MGKGICCELGDEAEFEELITRTQIRQPRRRPEEANEADQGHNFEDEEGSQVEKGFASEDGLELEDGSEPHDGTRFGDESRDDRGSERLGNDLENGYQGCSM